MNPHLTTCRICGGCTSRKHARMNAGRCKTCTQNLSALIQARGPIYPSLPPAAIDSGWEAYAREEGHYDEGRRSIMESCITSKMLREAISEAIERDPQPYSGRSMYGKRCIGIVTSDPICAAVSIALLLRDRAAGEDADHDIAQLFAKARTDDMGKSSILYFPTRDWEEEAEERSSHADTLGKEFKFEPYGGLEKEMMVEASDVGIPPGSWPRSINVISPDGRSHEFKRGELEKIDGEMVGYRYWSYGDTYLLRVLND